MSKLQTELMLNSCVKMIAYQLTPVVCGVCPTTIAFAPTT